MRLVDDCRAFYAALGFEDAEPPPGIIGRAAWLQREGTQVHLLFVDGDAAVGWGGHVAIVAPDYEAAVERLRAAGHAVEPRRAHWGAARCYARDPAGHTVEIMAFAPGG
jgi:catechol 2,3-dioxygenase-like lactoylglutathione lyase family enzyme